ncbi:MAG: hypothetical protein ACOC6J_00870 [Spirochaetota bacterium]
MKRLAFTGILVLLAATAGAFDWGGYLDNTTGYASPPPGGEAIDSLIQRLEGGLWLEQPIGSWTLDAQGILRWTPADSPKLLADLDRLTLSADVIATEAGAATFGFTVGRGGYTDATGHVLNHTLDGVKLLVNMQRSSFGFAAGTTALVQKPANAIVISRLDATDLSDGTKLFAPPKLIADFQYRMLEFFAGQHLTVAATVQEDLRPRDQLTEVGTEIADPDAGGRLDTQYVTLKSNGPIGPGIFQTTYYTLNSGRRLEYVDDADSGTGFSYQYRPVLAHLAGAELTWFLPQTLNSRARLFGQFSTGDADGTDWSQRFVPLAPVAYSDVFSLQPGNSAHLGVSYSLRPLVALGSDVLQTELASVFYFRSTGSGRVSEPAVDASTTGAFVGSDINLTVTAVPFSDLRLVLKGGMFVPNQAVMNADNKTVDYQTSLQGVLRF